MPFSDREDLLTDPVFLIGNGKSRSNFDLERLRKVGTIVGCNALYREFTPDVLVAIDAKMLRELKNANYGSSKDQFTIVPKSRQVVVSGARIWHTDRFNTSGCFAMKLISQVMQPKNCYMLGMDGYPGNMYDGTENYAPNTLNNFSGVLTYYLQALTGPGETIFINVNEKDAWPQEARDTKKYKCISYNEFENEVL